MFDPESLSYCKTILSFCLLLSAFVVISTIEFAGFVTSLVFKPAECYAAANIMELAPWMTVTCIITLILILLLMIAICCKFRSNDTSFGTVTCANFLICIFLMASFSFTIIGIVELTYQYQECLSEVRIVSVMSIVVIVFNFITYACACGAIHFTYQGKSGYLDIF